MASFRVELSVHGRPVTFLADADSAEQVRAGLDEAWVQKRRCVYQTPSGRRIEVEWKNLAVFEIASITEA